MKKQSLKRNKTQAQGKRNPGDADAVGARGKVKGAEAESGPGKVKDVKPLPSPRPAPKKTADRRVGKVLPLVRYANVSVQFLRESKMELKKVKWPTRKELLASTAVVIVLSLLVSFYLGIVDFGLIKIIRVVIG